MPGIRYPFVTTWRGRRFRVGEGTAGATEEATFDKRLAVLLAMAMFVLVVDTSLMNVSISAVVHDLGATVSSIQSRSRSRRSSPPRSS
jgi:hypothetical protein